MSSNLNKSSEKTHSGQQITEKLLSGNKSFLTKIFMFWSQIKFLWNVKICHSDNKYFAKKEQVLEHKNYKIFKKYLQCDHVENATGFFQTLYIIHLFFSLEV